MRTVHVTRLQPWRRVGHQPRRHYAVRAPGQAHQHIKTVADLKSWKTEAPVSDVEVCGWVRSVRKSSGVRFVDVTDGSSMRPVQAVVDKALSAEYALSRHDPRPDHSADHLFTLASGLELPFVSRVHGAMRRHQPIRNCLLIKSQTRFL